MEDKKSYYAIIPANVRYDTNLTPNAKLLYGEITALCNEKGYCWASNDYFAKLYGVSKQSISSWISSLIKGGYIYSEIQYKEGSKEILHRYIKLFEYPIKENLNTPIKENLKDNNTNINNTINITIEKEIKETWDAYVDMRKKLKKPMTDYAKKLALKKLDELSNGDVDIKIKILNQSIVNSWQGLFPLKEEKHKPQYPQQKQYGREDTSFSIELAEQKAQAFLRGEIDICGKRR